MNPELPKTLREALARQTAGDSHPSPDALTAFVEHSLPARESQRVTDHLAKCTDCREVVFLASSALEEPVGEEQEWMPATAVPRISPALLAKTDVASNGADAGSAASARRGWTLRWAWVPVVAVVVLVSAVLVRRSDFVGLRPQSEMTVASKEPALSAAPNSQPAAFAPAQPESERQLAPQKPLAKSARSESKPARPSDVLPSALVASNASEQYPSARPVAAAPEPLSADAASEAVKSVPAVPRQNSFAESEARSNSNLVAGSQEKPQMGLFPAVVVKRHWRVTADGHLERSTASGNWAAVLTDQPAAFRVVSVVGDDVWAGGSGGMLFHSSDGGQTWNKQLLSSPASVEKGIIVSIRFSDALNGVITTDEGTRWNTSDGGVTWTRE
jgi:Photosynthesis system II assembly factor YCF48/Putative zinc-finger